MYHITIPQREAKRTTKKGGYIIIVLGEVLSASRGLHLLTGEKSADNLKNEGISRAKILTFSDVYEYHYKNENTIRPDGERVYKNGKKSTREKTEVFVNLTKRYKNSVPQRYDTILQLKANSYSPKLVYWEDENKIMEYIYSNDIIFLRKNSDRIEPLFIYYIMNSAKVKEYLNAESERQTPKRLKCSIIKDIKVDLPDVKTQREILKKLIKDEESIENLIKMSIN